MTSSKLHSYATPQCIGIFALPFISDHMMLSCLKAVPVAYARDVVQWKNRGGLACICRRILKLLIRIRIQILHDLTIIVCKVIIRSWTFTNVLVVKSRMILRNIVYERKLISRNNQLCELLQVSYIRYVNFDYF